MALLNRGYSYPAWGGMFLMMVFGNLLWIALLGVLAWVVRETPFLLWCSSGHSGRNLLHQKYKPSHCWKVKSEKTSWPHLWPQLPDARFLEECRGQQSGFRGHLLGGIGLPMLQPPGDGLHKQCGGDVWHKLI